MKYFTLNDIKNSKVASINTHLFEEKKTKEQRKEAKSLTEMKNWLRMLNIPFEEEYRFDKKRRFRFDIAFPENMIAVEFEGIMSEKSRHTSVTGYSKDTEKYTLAALQGWKVLRYTVINYKNFLSDIEEILK